MIHICASTASYTPLPPSFLHTHIINIHVSIYSVPSLHTRHNGVIQGHFTTSPVSHWLDQYNAMPSRVVIEDEANYEQLKYASMTDNVPGWLARQSAWQSQVGGATGFTCEYALACAPEVVKLMSVCM